MKRVIALLLATAALAGCGSEEASDAEQIQEVLDDYALATRTHDAELFCTEVTAARPTSLEQCIEQVGNVLKDRGTDLNRGDVLRPLGEPQIDGDRATLRISDDGGAETITLLRGSGGWRIVFGN